MYLKYLEINGFKSFPDRVKLEFGKGLTAVVGPNGSGKSNISDAVRWVLGEQSSKTLRGDKMEDVIFGGTQLRRPMGFAQVTLTIGNEDRDLPIDTDEISITRKLYRSGDSEYRINDNAVRLRDIHELFMDTGLGRDGYSMIGQGKIAEIISAKSTMTANRCCFILLEFNKRGVQVAFIKDEIHSGTMANYNYIETGTNIFSLTHEFGHLIDCQKEHPISQNKELINIYIEEYERFKKIKPKSIEEIIIRYFTPTGGTLSLYKNSSIYEKIKEANTMTGLSEIIAETNALLYSYGSRNEAFNSRTNYLIRFFPKTIAKAASLLTTI